MQNWYLLYATSNLTKASIIKGMLEENSVPVMLINKQSSTYIIFGDIELYVPVHFKDIAKQLLDKGMVN
ncbi:MAG: DUF2007 domain-containing protein [Segetibacter sp.]